MVECECCKNFKKVSNSLYLLLGSEIPFEKIDISVFYKKLELLLSSTIKAIPSKVFGRWGAGKKAFFQKGLFPAKQYCKIKSLPSFPGSIAENTILEKYRSITEFCGYTAACFQSFKVIRVLIVRRQRSSAEKLKIFVNCRCIPSR